MEQPESEKTPEEAVQGETTEKVADEVSEPPKEVDTKPADDKLGVNWNVISSRNW